MTSCFMCRGFGVINSSVCPLCSGTKVFSGGYYLGAYHMDSSIHGVVSYVDSILLRQMKESTPYPKAIEEFSNRLTYALSTLKEDGMDMSRVVLTPYPTHEKGKFNPNLVAVLKSVAKELGVSYEEVIERTDTVDKKAKGNFRQVVEEVDSLNVKNINMDSIYVVVDDITTKGVSLDAAEEVLNNRGAPFVMKVALGVGAKEDIRQSRGFRALADMGYNSEVKGVLPDNIGGLSRVAKKIEDTLGVSLKSIPKIKGKHATLAIASLIPLSVFAGSDAREKRANSRPAYVETEQPMTYYKNGERVDYDPWIMHRAWNERTRHHKMGSARYES